MGHLQRRYAQICRLGVLWSRSGVARWFSPQTKFQSKIFLSLSACRHGPAKRFKAAFKNRNSRTMGDWDGLPLFQIAGPFPEGVGPIGGEGMGEGQADGTVETQPKGGAT